MVKTIGQLIAAYSLLYTGTFLTDNILMVSDCYESISLNEVYAQEKIPSSLEAKIREQYEYYLRREDYYSVKQMLEAIGHCYKPPEEIVHNNYREHMKHGQLKKLEELHNITNIPFPFTDSEIHDRGLKLLKATSYKNLEFLENIFDTRITFSEDEIQDVTMSYVRSSRFRSISKLERFIGRKLSIDEDILRQICDEYIRKGQYDRIDELRVNGITPEFSPDLVQDIYQSALSEGDYSKISKMKVATKIQPRIKPSEIHNQGLEYLTQEKYSSIRELEEATSEEIDYSDMELRTIYDAYLKKEDYPAIYGLYELTGKLPTFSDQLLMATCERYLRDGQYRKVEAMLFHSCISPNTPPYIVRNIYDAAFSSGNYQTIRTVESATNIKPDFTMQLVHEKYKDLIGRPTKWYSSGLDEKMTEWREEVKDVYELSGLKPDIDTIIKNPNHLIESVSGLLVIHYLMELFDIKISLDENRVKILYGSRNYGFEKASCWHLLHEITGIAPGERDVGQYQSKLLGIIYRSMQWKNRESSKQKIYKEEFELTKKWFGVKNSYIDTDIKEAYEFFFQNYRYDDIKFFRELTEVRPPRSLFDQYYTRLLSNDLKDEAEILMDVSGYSGRYGNKTAI